MKGNIGFVGLAILVVATGGLSGCVAHRSEFEGRIVDAETQQPIEGAVVLAHWRLEYYVLEKQDGGAVQLIETKTDKDGRFKVPSWTKVYWPFRGLMEDHMDPELIMFKDGYEFRLARSITEFRSKQLKQLPPTERSKKLDLVTPNELNGKTFQLVRVTPGSSVAAANEGFSYVGGRVFGRRERKGCMWPNAATMLQTLSDAQTGSRSLGINMYSGSITACGQEKNFTWR
ncbi:MAG TPA: hypothetical protein VK629_15375 [Steroidobacteraceae bacterium]|nr:hypothetical protein [Steroidobacteraceae bacterium]